MSLRRVSVIGSGNWGSTIAKIVGNNIRKFPEYVSEVLPVIFVNIYSGSYVGFRGVNQWP